MSGVFSWTCPKKGLKTVLLHNGNIKPSVPVIHFVHFKKNLQKY